MCPICRSSSLSIRKLEGFERLMVIFTGKRKYICRDCEHKFRAVDRRRVPRENPGAQATRATKLTR
jgi:transposase-like protein